MRLDVPTTRRVFLDLCRVIYIHFVIAYVHILTFHYRITQTKVRDCSLESLHLRDSWIRGFQG